MLQTVVLSEVGTRPLTIQHHEDLLCSTPNPQQVLAAISARSAHQMVAKQINSSFLGMGSPVVTVTSNIAIL
jgi:hypothetical protein